MNTVAADPTHITSNFLTGAYYHRKVKKDNEEATTFRVSGGCFVVPAIWGLCVCHCPGPAEHEMLRLYAVHASES
ncbi:MAG: hypothetical protein WA876_14700 [Candidatus Acidiferrales bacterium]